MGFFNQGPSVFIGGCIPMNLSTDSDYFLELQTQTSWGQKVDV